MRTSLLLIPLFGLAACGRDHGFPIKPLPELVVARSPVAPIIVRELLLVPQEKMIWDVHWKGLTVGRIELTVGAADVHSRFKTGAIVSTMTSVNHELATLLDRLGARPDSQHESLTVDGEARTINATFDAAGYRLNAGNLKPVQKGVHMHTLHTALGALRAWARPGAKPGFLLMLVAGQELRLELAEPVAEQLADRATLRVDGRVRGGEQPAQVTIWLHAGEDRTPLRIEIASDDARITAELIDQ
jgi:hypothetical protein